MGHDDEPQARASGSALASDVDDTHDVRPAGRRCLEHGLVVAADGRCVVCRRERAAEAGTSSSMVAGIAEGAAVQALGAASPNERPKTRWPILLGGGFVALFAVAALAYALRTRDEGPVATLTPAASITPVASLEATDVAAASRRVNVRAYTTKWCGACASARAWMRRERIRFVEYDVDSSRSAQRRLRELNPSGGIPTIEVERQVLVGFDPERLKRAILSAAARTPRR